MQRKLITRIGVGLCAGAFCLSGVAKAAPIESQQALKPPVVYATQTGTKLTLERDSAIVLRLDEFVSSQSNHEGDRLRFTVDRPLVARGFVLVPRGARAYGVITEVRPARGWARGGKMTIELTHVEAYDGTKIPLSTVMDGSKGQDYTKTGAYAAGMLLAPVSLLVAPVGAGLKGKRIEVAEGTLFSAFVKEDVTWKLKKTDGKMVLPGSKGTHRIGEGPVNPSLQGECMTDICSEYQGEMFRTCMSKCQGY